MKAKSKSVPAAAQPVVPVYKPLKSHRDDNMDASEWSTVEVAKWLSSIGLGEFGPEFARNKVTGDIMHVLSEEHYKEMGVTLIGDRALLMLETARLYRGAVHHRRFRTIWEAEGIMFEGGCTDWCCKQMMCYSCCNDPDHYKLTGSTLYVTEVDRKKYRGSCCVTSKLTRAIDLSNVKDVSDYHQSTCLDCGCAADRITVMLDGSLDLGDVTPLLVKKGDGADIAHKIQAAVEEAQSHGAVGHHKAMVRM